jgi:hypothetical protein
LAKPTTATTQKKATISAAGHASSPRAIALTGCIVQLLWSHLDLFENGSLNDGARRRHFALRLPVTTQVFVLACTSQWSKVSLHAKARMEKIRPGIRIRIPQYIVSAGNKEK